MLLSEDNKKKRDAIFSFEQRIETMHLEFQKYHQTESQQVPDWERLENELFRFSRTKIQDLELSNQLDRILYKFQNRKIIWLKWVEEVHRLPAGDLQ